MTFKNAMRVMNALGRCLVLCLSLTPLNSEALTVTEFNRNIEKYYESRGKQFDHLYDAASKKYGVDKDILIRMGGQESGYWHPDVISGKKRSSAGAIGIAQFMPATAKRFGIDPLNVEQSIDAQGKYMSHLLKMFDGDYRKAVAAYNWGEGNVQKKGLDNMPRETQHYIDRIINQKQNTEEKPHEAEKSWWNPTGWLESDEKIGWFDFDFGDFVKRVSVGVMGITLLATGLYLKGATT